MVAIVDPETAVPVAEARSARSGCRARAWRRATGTAPRRPSGPSGANRRHRRGPFLRTGDLGFLRRRAVRHRPAQGPDHHPGPEHLPPGHRVGRSPAAPRLGERRARSRSRPTARSGSSSSRRSSGQGEDVTAILRGHPPGRSWPRSTSWTSTPSPAEAGEPAQDLQRQGPAPRLPRGFLRGGRAAGSLAEWTRRRGLRPRPARPAGPAPGVTARPALAQLRIATRDGWWRGWRDARSTREAVDVRSRFATSGWARCRRSASPASSRSGSAARSRRRSSTTPDDRGARPPPRRADERGTARCAAPVGRTRTSRSRSSGSAAGSPGRRPGGVLAAAARRRRRSREVPADRWDVDACYDPDPGAGQADRSRGGFLEPGRPVRRRLLRHLAPRGGADGPAAAAAAGGRLGGAGGRRAGARAAGRARTGVFVGICDQRLRAGC